MTTATEPQAALPRLGSVWGWTIAAVIVAVALYPLLTGGLVSGYVEGIVLLAGINITLAVSLNIINGMTGQFSIGHAGFVAVGAHVGAVVTVLGGTWLERLVAGGVIDPTHPAINLFLVPIDGQPPGAATLALGQLWFAFAGLLAGAAAGLMGVLVGVPTLHLRGDYLAIATLGFGEIVRVVLLNLEVVGGASGFNGIEPFGRIPQYSNLLNVYLVALLCVLAATNLKRSTHGRALLAIQADEVAAEAVGIDTTRYKVFAFALSAFFAGVAGALLAHYHGNINPRMFNFMLSIEVIVMVVLGGTGSTTGCVIAAVLLTILPEWLRDLHQWRMVLYAEVLLIMMLVRRQGLLGAREITSRDWVRLGAFLRAQGLRGVARATLHWLRTTRDPLRNRLVRHGQSRLLAWLAAGLVLMPLLDVLAAWWLPPATQPYPRTYAAEITASLSQLLHQGLVQNPMTAPLAGELQLPFAPNLGLSVALLILILPWTQLSFQVAAGERRAMASVLALLTVALWHGCGLLAQGFRLPRVWFEALVPALLIGGLLVVLVRGRGRSR